MAITTMEMIITMVTTNNNNRSTSHHHPPTVITKPVPVCDVIMFFQLVVLGELPMSIRMAVCLPVVVEIGLFSNIHPKRTK
jgi:hypothetical protein